jgi:hypothetical protein
VQKKSNQSAIIKRTLHPSDRCLHISEVLNSTILKYDFLRQIKYYHVPCREDLSKNLSCFYDNIHFCFCQDINQQRVTNCFEFEHNLKMNCSGKSGCQHGGECFQDDSVCPKTSLCVCPQCFHGRRCQLSTSGFSLSLDAILGYHIQPNINILHQPNAVLISLILTVIITVGGMINGVLSLITFTNKKTRETGCGRYLLCLSINTLLTMAIFALKVSIFLPSQMGFIMNQTFLHIQCRSIDFLIRVCLTMDQWLTTCIAIERAFITKKGIHFDQKKTKAVVKWVIMGLICLTVGTAIHDPIYRRLFDDDNEEENKIWCIVEYSFAIHIINSVMTIFHIIVPFVINLLSAIIIIIMGTRQRAIIRTQRTYEELLNEQFQQHKNLLIGPVVLIILAIPRLIITFASDCMKSASDSWLFLFGYFISLIPPTLTFILFVLPSSIYHQEFRKAISRYRKIKVGLYK